MFRKKIKEQEVTSVISALSEVINFLNQCGTGEIFWQNNLIEIKNELLNKETFEEALFRLKNYFGGMGSLNDLYFCETNKNLPKNVNVEDFNLKWKTLLNCLFKEVYLFGKSEIDKKERE
jgi:hypothetical protein